MGKTNKWLVIYYLLRAVHNFWSPLPVNTLVISVVENKPNITYSYASTNCIKSSLLLIGYRLNAYIGSSFESSGTSTFRFYLLLINLFGNIYTINLSAPSIDCDKLAAFWNCNYNSIILFSIFIIVQSKASLYCSGWTSSYNASS